MSLISSGAREVKIKDIRPGSTVEIHDHKGYIEDFTGIVVAVNPEGGATAIPEIGIKVEGVDGLQTVTASGRWRVRVLVDSASLSAGYIAPNMLRVRKLPVEVETVRFNGGIDSATEIIYWGGSSAPLQWVQADSSTTEHISITTMEGVMRAEIGDFIIRGVKGELYPCKPDIFMATYELIEGALND